VATDPSVLAESRITKYCAWTAAGWRAAPGSVYHHLQHERAHCSSAAWYGGLENARLGNSREE